MVDHSTILSSDWIKLIIFYIIMIFTRYLMIIILYPILKRVGFGITKEEIYALVWTGLRGVIGLTLALMVMVDNNIENIRFK